MKKLLLVLTILALSVASARAIDWKNVYFNTAGYVLITPSAIELTDMVIYDLPENAEGITITAFNNSTTAVAGSPANVTVCVLNSYTTSKILSGGNLPISIPFIMKAINNAWGSRDKPVTCSNGLVIRVEAGTNSVNGRVGFAE